MVISGRDLAGPALDWDADPTLTLTGIPLEQALQRVFAGVGLPVRITTADAARKRAETAEAKLRDECASREGSAPGGWAPSTAPGTPPSDARLR